MQYEVCPRSNENDFFLRSAEGPGKESGGRGRWSGNPGIHFDLPQLSPRLCSTRYVSKMRNSVWTRSRLIIICSCIQLYKSTLENWEWQEDCGKF
jgi:hypothetical protein